MKFTVLLFTSIIIHAKGFTQVNLQTGSATFSLPMFNWQDSKSNLNTVIALSYNSGSGLKVNEVASNVGQGWNLVAGGVVTRMQVGEPDDQIARGSVDEKDLNKYPNGYLYAERSAREGCPEALIKYPIYKHKNQLYKQHNSVAEDRELDYFSFQFNGKSGLFVLNTTTVRGDNPVPDVGVMLGDSKIKITFQRDPTLINQGIRTTITSFTIQDVDGLIYKFAKHGLTKLLKTKYCDKNLAYYNTQPDFKNGRVYYQADFETNEIEKDRIIGSWYLTEIRDPLTELPNPSLNRAVTFHYRTLNQNINNTAGQELSYNKEKNYSVISHRKSVTETPLLESISYPDGHLVVFKNDIGRVDLIGAKALSEVDIKYYGRFVSKYLINTTYFILNRYGKPVSDYQKRVARLCLKSVQKIGVDLKEDSPPYIFNYFTGSNDPNDIVPPPFAYRKDIWGFYNGEMSVDYTYNLLGSFLSRLTNTELNNADIKGLCFLRNNSNGMPVLNPRPGYAKNGLLQQIIYPTGGTLSYAYEQNMGVMRGQYQAVGGVHVSSTSSTDGGGSNDCANPITTLYKYVLEGGGNLSSLWGLEDPLNHTEMSSYYAPQTKRYKPPIFGGGLFGNCVYKYAYPGILSVEQATSLSDVMQIMQAIGPVLGVVGSVSSVLNAVKLAAKFSGAFAIVSLALDVISGLYTVISTCLVNPNKTITSTVYYAYDINSVSPLPAQFKRVEVIENPGDVGKTVYDFTSDTDYPVWHLTNPNQSSRQRFASWDYGLPKKITVLDKFNHKVKETENEYDTLYKKSIAAYYFFKGEYNPPGFESKLVSCKCKVEKTFSQKNTEWAEPAVYNPAYLTTSLQNPDLKVEFYPYYTGRRNLIKTTERVFKEGSSTVFVENSTEYKYNDFYNYEVSQIKTTSSDGNVTVKAFSYSSEYPSDPVIGVMAENNIIAIPVSTATLIAKQGADYQTLAENRTEFTRLATGAIKPSKIFEKRFSSPTASAGTVPFKEVKSFTYDDQGNLIGVKDEGGRLVTNIYDYDDKYVTATLINADPVAEKYYYTSFETPSLGKWSLGGSPNPVTTASPTGEKSFGLNGTNSLTANSLDASKEYRLSFWATSALSVTGGGSLVVAEPTLNGFTYYEYDIASGASSITLSGNAVIDEVRLYPRGARMSTVTYDPLIGKTSECDANNRITYYEYDNLGRMRLIKDEKRNIVKMYEYNNVSRQNGCPGIYYSKYTSEVFTRNNCGPGYMGTDTAYKIPANKYTSTISQEDADAQVEAELNALGQAYANANGFCRLIYYNNGLSQSFTTGDCPEGYVGGSVTYTVPAGRYWSILSQLEVDEMEADDLAGNGDAYANDPANANCTLNTNPDWEYDENPQTQCMPANGQNYIHVLATNVNPNSTTYMQTSWINTGDPGSCSPTYDCTIFYNNNSGYAQFLTLTNRNSGQQFYFYMSAGVSGILGNVPSGNYDIVITTSSYTNHTYRICGGFGYPGGYGHTQIDNTYIGCGCENITVD